MFPIPCDDCLDIVKICTLGSWAWLVSMISAAKANNYSFRDFSCHKSTIWWECFACIPWAVFLVSSPEEICHSSLHTCINEHQFVLQEVLCLLISRKQSIESSKFFFEEIMISSSDVTIEWTMKYIMLLTSNFLIA